MCSTNRVSYSLLFLAQAQTTLSNGCSGDIRRTIEGSECIITSVTVSLKLAGIASRLPTQDDINTYSPRIRCRPPPARRFLFQPGCNRQIYLPFLLHCVDFFLWMGDIFSARGLYQQTSDNGRIEGQNYRERGFRSYSTRSQHQASTNN